MSSILPNRREYTPDQGNIYEWLVEECERLRHWSKRGPIRAYEQPIPRLRSLRSSFNAGHVPNLLQPKEASAQSAGEDPFKVSQRRKL